MAKIDKPVITPNLGTLHLAHSKPNQPFLLNFVVKPVRMALFSNIIHRSTNPYLKPIIQAIHLLLPSLDKSMKSLNSFVPKRDRIHKPKANMKEIHHPGYLRAQDIFYIGNLKGVGRIFQQTFIDTYSKVVRKLYTTKIPITAADLFK